ncbi:hypothetical protein EIO60_00147|nr:hypothetical protein [Candidatus Pantoea persica]
MQKVPMDIMIMVIASTFCRPMRSPSGSNTRPPMGRTRKAAAKVPNAASRCAVLLALAKKTLLLLQISRVPATKLVMPAV